MSGTGENIPVDVEDDDAPQGRLLSRKEVLAIFGGAAAFLLAPRAPAAGAPCVALPELTEGPFFVDERLDRADIRVDPADGSTREGAPLKLTFTVSRMTPEGCKPLPGAMLDLWHCDAAGAYSDVRGGGGPGRGGDTEGKKFLRGYQITDENGAATFTTIYPGWYPGRAVHIHFKVRSAPDASARFEFTSQLFFDDKLSDRVHAKAPYAEHGQRDQRNKDDDIYFDGGFALVLDVKEDGDGYAASFDVALHTEQDKKPAA